MTKPAFTKAERQRLSEMGKKGGPARAKALSKSVRVSIAKKAVAARWAKYYAEKAEKTGSA